MATATSKLQIILDVLGGAKARGTLTDIKSGLDMVGMALNKVSQFAKAAYAALSEGAQLELATIQFDRLATSIGTTGDVLMNKLGPAVGGMLSQADQMKLAGDLMSLGLAKTTDEAVRLTGVAAQLGMNMNQLVLTLTNQTTMRFDALGVAVDGFDEKVKALEDTGMSADEAFKWAFIEQAEDQIKKVGSVSDTTAGQLMILESSAADAKNALKLLAATMGGPVVSKINEQYQAMNLLSEAYDLGELSYTEYMIGMTALLSVFVDGAIVTEEWTGRLEDLNSTVKTSEKDISKLKYAIDLYAETAASSGRTSKNLTYDFVAMAIATVELDSKTQTLGGSFDNVSRQAAGAITSTESLFAIANTNIGSPISQYIADLEWFVATGGKIEEMFQAIVDSSAPPDAKLEAAKELLGVYYDAKTEIGDMKEWPAAQELSDAIGVPLQEALDMLRGTDGIEEAMAGLADIDVGNQTLDEYNQSLVDAKETLGELTQSPHTIDVVLHGIMTGVWGNLQGGGSGGSGSGSGHGGKGGSGIGGPGMGIESFSNFSGGGPTIIIDNLVVVTDSAYDLVSQLTTMQARSALGAVAGSGYAGT